LGLKEDSIKIGKYISGKITGDACVVFETVEDAKKAFKLKNFQLIGHRYIELFQIT